MKKKKLLTLLLALCLMCALSVNSLGLYIVPSVTQKAVPTIHVGEEIQEKFPDSDVVALLNDNEKQDEKGRDETLVGIRLSWLKIVSLMDDEEGILDIAVKDIQDADTIQELVKDLPTGNDLVVSELFDISASDDILEMLESPNTYVFLEFLYSGTEIPTILSKCSGVWKQIDPKDITLKDGVLSLKLYELCPFVFLSKPPKDSPITGTRSFPIFEVIGLAALAVVTVIMYKDHRKAL